MTSIVSPPSMRYSPKLVAFLDILGFRALTAQSTPSTELTIGFIQSQLRQVVLERVEHVNNGCPFDVRLFSDCIRLVSDDSAPGAAALLDSVAYLSLSFMTNGLPLRGGVALGRHFHSDHMIFSEALVQSYELESKHARWPRTLVTPAVANLASAHVPFLLRTDSDGATFVDYLEYVSLQHSFPDHRYDRHKSQILRGLSANEKLPSVLQKYQWLARYHNEKMRELKKRPASSEIITDQMFVPDAVLV